LFGGYLNLSVTIDILSELLEVNANTIINWELSLGLEVKTNNSGIKIYSEELVTFFKKVKSLILNGYNLSSIKDLLALEVKYHNNKELKEELINVDVEKILINIKEETQKKGSVDYNDNAAFFLNDYTPESSHQINNNINENELFTNSDLKYTQQAYNNAGSEKILSDIKEDGANNFNQNDMVSLF